MRQTTKEKGVSVLFKSNQGLLNELMIIFLVN